MGRDAVEARITLLEDRLEPGGRATLEFQVLAHDAVRIRGAHASFRAYEETQATYTTSDGETTTTHTAIEKHDLVASTNTFLGQPPQGVFHNLVDAGLTLLGGGDHVELAPGVHTARLDVDLPDRLPESFAAKKVKIVYEAAVHLDIPAGRDFAEVLQIEVAGEDTADDVDPRPLDIAYPEDSGRGFFDKLFGPDVAMRVRVPATVVRRGGDISGELEVRFPERPGRVDGIDCKLLRRESTSAQGHKDKHVATVATERIDRRDDGARNLFASFRVALPRDMPPSAFGAKFEMTHELAISLDVPWAKDPTVHIPITVL